MRAPNWLYANRTSDGVRVRRWGSWRVTLLSLSIVDEPAPAPLPALTPNVTVTLRRWFVSYGAAESFVWGAMTAKPTVSKVWAWRNGNGLWFARAGKAASDAS